MHFMVYLTRKSDEQPSPPSPEGMAEMMKLMEESMKSGLIVSTGQLSPVSTHLKLEAGEVSLSDGPFIEGKELVPGFTVIRVNSKQEAIDWATRLRQCMGDGELNVNQLVAGSTFEEE